MAALALGAVLAVGLAWTELPGAGLRWGLVKALHGLGMVEVSVDDADLSLFGGHVVVQKMVARPVSGTAFGLKDLALEFRWGPLLHKRVAVEKVALEGLEIDVRRQGDGFVVNGLPLVVAGSAGGEGRPWTFGIAALDLTDSRLVLVDGKTRAEIAIDRLAVENLQSWDSQVPVAYRLEGRINGAPVVVAGTATPFAARPGFDLTLALQHLDLASLAAAAAEAGVSALSGQASGELTLSGRLDGKELALDAAGRLTLDAPAVGGAVEASARTLTALVRHAGWDGQRRRLTLAATLDLAEPNAKAAAGTASATALHAEAGELSFDLAAGRVDWQGSASLTAAKLGAAGIEVAPDAAAWTGRAEANLAGPHPAGRLDGKLELGALRAGQGDLGFSQRHAVAEGAVEFGRQAPNSISGTLTARADGIGVRDVRKGQDWLAAERVEAGEVVLGADGAISAAVLALDGVAALRRDKAGAERGFPWRVEAKAARVTRPAMDATGAVSAAEATLDGLTLRLTRTGAGFVGFTGPSNPSVAASPPAAPLPRVALGQVTVSGNSRLLFEDRTTGEAVHLDVQPIDIRVGALDTAQPDRDSPFGLNATMGEATIAANGTLRPFADVFDGVLKGDIRALELPPLSPYMADALGIHLHTGHFDGDLQVALRKGALQGKMDLVLSNLFVAQPAADAPLARKVEMPIETVLDLLRDGEDRIRLSLPIGGNLANPDLDVSDAVSQAVAGALKSTALTTLKVMFPVAALISLVVDADDKARLALAPLAFAPGEDGLQDEHRRALAAVADLMRQRPGLKLTLCGRAGAADWPVLAERRRQEENPLLSRLQKLVGVERKAETSPPDHDALADLAGRRAASAKEHLADHAGIDAGRLYECRPEVDGDVKGEAREGAKGPRVELLL
jgi:hypothetical protein